MYSEKLTHDGSDSYCNRDWFSMGRTSRESCLEPRSRSRSQIVYLDTRYENPCPFRARALRAQALPTHGSQSGLRRNPRHGVPKIRENRLSESRSSLPRYPQEAQCHPTGPFQSPAWPSITDLPGSMPGFHRVVPAGRRAT